MKNTKKLLVIAVILSVVLVACKKTPTNPTTTPLYSSSNIVFDTNKIAFQTKTWTLADSSGWGMCCGDSALIFSGGTQIIFKDSSFLNYLGVDTPQWYKMSATFCVKELFKNSDWIFSNMQTVDSGRRAIQSFGAIFLAVIDQYGDTAIDLDYNNYAPPHDSTDWLNRAQFRVKIPAKGNGLYDYNAYNGSLDTMKVYINDLDTVNTPPNLLTYPTLNWWTYPYNAFNFIYPSANAPYYYTFAIKDSLSINRWYNLADINANVNQYHSGLLNVSQGLTTTLTIQNSTSSSYADAQIFFVLDAPWKVTVLKAVKSPINATQFLIPNVPLNVSGKIVAWCVSSGNQLYSNYNTTNGSFQVINPVSLTNNTLTILYQQVAISDLTTYIKAIN